MLQGGGADVVTELIASCKKYNLKLGFFYSVHFNWYLGVDGAFPPIPSVCAVGNP
jgi:hypothetical protein